ncbi:MAG: alpha/beta hydrolase [Sphingomicrobium sp.]
MKSWSDRYWNSPDGLRLHYRDYDGPHERPPILCIPGLTRNCRDFEPVAEAFAGAWRVIAVDLRGRGLSEPDPNPLNYIPQTYAQDLIKLLDQLGIADAVFIGTSLGGIVTMVTAMQDSERIAGALLNDIGPRVEPEGIARIGAYVGKPASVASFGSLAGALAERNRDAFPNWDIAQWERFARRIASDKGGSIEFDYDPRIADPFAAAAAAAAAADAPPSEAWPYYKALAGRPLTVLRGEYSDLFSAETFERMGREVPDVELVTVPRAGHAPSLDEPESLAAIERLLDRVLARPPLAA